MEQDEWKAVIRLDDKFSTGRTPLPQWVVVSHIEAACYANVYDIGVQVRAEVDVELADGSRVSCGVCEAWYTCNLFGECPCTSKIDVSGAPSQLALDLVCKATSLVLGLERDPGFRALVARIEAALLAAMDGEARAAAEAHTEACKIRERQLRRKEAEAQMESAVWKYLDAGGDVQRLLEIVREEQSRWVRRQ